MDSCESHRGRDLPLVTRPHDRGFGVVRLWSTPPTWWGRLVAVSIRFGPLSDASSEPLREETVMWRAVLQSFGRRRPPEVRRSMGTASACRGAEIEWFVWPRLGEAPGPLTLGVVRQSAPRANSVRR
jgi:hypothetical protein